RLAPRESAAYAVRAAVQESMSQYADAVPDYRKSIEFEPNNPMVVNNFAWLLATCPQSDVRDGSRAVDLATKACALSSWKKGSVVDTGAAAYAEAGDFAKAAEWQEKSIAYGEFTSAELKGARERLELYRAQKPFRTEPKPAGNRTSG